MSAGIYKITSPSGKIYIGQSINIERRMKTYSLCKCEKQTALYNSFKKYGFDSHLMEIVFELNVVDVHILNLLEVAFIKYFDCLSPNGLNITPGGGNWVPTDKTIEKMRMASLGRKHSRETKDKLSLLKLELGMSENHKNNIRLSNKARALSVDQYTKGGDYIKTFNSITEAANTVGCDGASITAVCKNSRHNKSAKGYGWKYTNNIIN